jgi:hypothetical protein
MSRRHNVGRILPLVLAITLTPMLMGTGNAQHEVLRQDLPPGSANSDDLPSNGSESEMDAIRQEIEQGREHGFYNGVKTWHDQDVISYWAYRLAVPRSRDLRKEICDRWRAAPQDFPMTGNISVFGAEMSLNKTCGIK